jgi:NAD(P)-dependent dehydrogenase (short-subunit alcohol dehydrogenase family)
LITERLKNKNAVIFGGAGRIGQSVATAFVQNGATVFVIDRNEENLTKLTESLNKTNQCFCYPMDINCEKDAEALALLLQKHMDAPDILVNCPAYISRSAFLSMPIEEFDKQMHTNVRLVLLVSKQIARLMSEKRKGKIINLASVGGTRPEKEHLGHCTAKAAVIAASKVMALELANYGIQVNVVAPGPTETIPFSSPFYATHPEILRRIEENTPLGRIGHPDDHIGLIVFLASEESNWITGQVILSDGGLTLR